MQEKHNEATINRPEGDRPIDAPLMLIDLPSLIEQIKTEDAWSKNDRNAITAFKTDGMRIVLVALHENAEMTPHETDGVLSIQVVEGKIKFKTEQESVDVYKGQV
ncbi:MAG: hypothetical protein M3O67_01240, partial [Bacteroidota bacterium]|nr:hypothetical protein [Bacteroidota bacterium]